jgi:diguanylate cyclase (GGDEF)-like protein
MRKKAAILVCWRAKLKHCLKPAMPPAPWHESCITQQNRRLRDRPVGVYDDLRDYPCDRGIQGQEAGSRAGNRGTVSGMVMSLQELPASRAETEADAPAVGDVALRDVSDELVKAIGISREQMTPHVRQTIIRLLSDVERLRQELFDTRSRIEYLERLTDQDALTPVANRRAFMRELNRTIAYSYRHKVASSIVYVDLNRMKEINDRYGHVAGDMALLYVSNTLVQNVRRSDLVGRLGGDEFGLIMQHANYDQAYQKATRLAKHVADHPVAANGKPLIIQGEPIYVTISFGVHMVTSRDDAASALAMADKAMYTHKNQERAAR